jgi:hypothetical protein
MPVRKSVKRVPRSTKSSVKRSVRRRTVKRSAKRQSASRSAKRQSASRSAKRYTNLLVKRSVRRTRRRSVRQ